MTPYRVTTSRGERGFCLSWPRWQPPPGHGVVALVTQPEATLGWADALLARDDTGLHVWAAARGELERFALEILELPGVRVAALAPDGADPRRVNLSLEVATWLESGGADCTASPTGARLTSWSPPAPPPGTVRIPHLVTVRRAGAASAAVTDDVVWELMSTVAAQRWLDGCLPDQQFVETHLDGLLRLRAAARTGRLPASAAARLTYLLCERDLSTELVYRRLDLFRRLLEPVE